MISTDRKLSVALGSLLIFSLGAYALAATGPFTPGQTTDPSCLPTDSSCYVALLYSLNGDTSGTQTFAVGTSGTDFNVSTSSGVHTFNIPDASATARGLVTTGTQTFAGSKTFTSRITSQLTTEQLRVGYDASNYYSTTVGSTGGVTFDAVGSGAAFNFSDNISTTGHIGLGTTSYATWGSGWNSIQGPSSINSLVLTGSTGNGLGLSQNAYFDGANWKYVATANVANYAISSGAHLFRYASSGTAGTNITWNTGMYISSTGQVGIGTSSPNNIGAGLAVTLENAAMTALEFKNTSGALGVSSDVGAIPFYTATAGGRVAQIYVSSGGATGAGDMQFYTRNGTAGSLTAAMTIDRNGNTNFGTNTGTASARVHIVSTTEQLRVGYDSSNYYKTTVGSTGGVTFDAVGSGSAFTFSDAVTTSSTLNGAYFKLGASRSIIASTGSVASLSGDDNVFIGDLSGNATTTGYRNTFLGSSSGRANTDGYYNTAIGYQSLWNGSSGPTSAGENTAIGYQTLQQGGFDNTAIGIQALNAMTGNYGVAVGQSAALLNTASYTVAIGAQALRSNTTGTQNTAVGYQAGYLSTGNDNFYAGWQAGKNAGAVSNNTFIGSQVAGSVHPISGNGGNTLVGAFSGYYLQTGEYNVAIGYASGQNFDSGSYNVFLGYSAGYGISTGTNNVAIGRNTMSNSLTGTENIALGTQAGNSTTSGGHNVFIGQQAGFSSTGSTNVYIGKNAGYYNTSGSNNVVIGSYDMTSFATVSSNIFLADGVGNARLRIDSSGNVGIGTGTATISARMDVETDSASGYAGYFFNDGNNANRNGILVQSGLDDNTAAGPSTLIGFKDGDGTAIGSITFGSSAVAYNTTSDVRLKENIVNTALGIDDLMKIQIRDYTWKADPEHKITHGVIAQELYQIYPQAVTMPIDEATGYWMVDYSKLTPLLVKSVQDLDLKFTPLTSLDTANPNSLGSLIKKFLADAANTIADIYTKNIHSDTVDTKQLCVGAVCVTEAQFLQMVQSVGARASIPVQDTPPSNDSPSSGDTDQQSSDGTPSDTQDGNTTPPADTQNSGDTVENTTTDTSSGTDSTTPSTPPSSTDGGTDGGSSEAPAS